MNYNHIQQNTMSNLAMSNYFALPQAWHKCTLPSQTNNRGRFPDTGIAQHFDTLKLWMIETNRMIILYFDQIDVYSMFLVYRLPL